MITEDIDVSWRLQLDHWDLQYVPKALCYILCPKPLEVYGSNVCWAQGVAWKCYCLIASYV